MQNRNIVNEEFRALQENSSIFVGRKSSVFKEHGSKAAMNIGMVAEERSDSAGFYRKEILMDSISPHAVFICGMRGSGKSYTLGVIGEELALKNEAVGVIIIDPMGIFWSMRSPNKVEREQDLLKKWELSPTGINTMKVFIPAGYAKEAPQETWDTIFTLRPSELTAEDWCLTFGFDRFDTMGLLLDRVIERVKGGYTTADGQLTEGLKDTYSIESMIQCIEYEEGINSSQHGFKNSTRRALIARLRGALEWGIFDKEGTKLRDLSRRGQTSVIDVSFLQDNVRALVVGILARTILNTRKKISRKEAVGMTGLLESVPVTWLMIDEAHILVPGAGRKTAATDALIEYVRQGRQPGCSIVLATQQPSAIDSRILSQVDIVVCHKLVYEDDIKAVMRRMPSEVPERFHEDRFIKNLPIGTAIIGDKQEETSRCFLASIRPRISQHEGRERQPILEIDPLLMRENVKKLIKEKWGKETTDELEKLIQIVNEEYKLNFTLSEILNELTEEGFLAEIDGKENACDTHEVEEEVEPSPPKSRPTRLPQTRPHIAPELPQEMQEYKTQQIQETPVQTAVQVEQELKELKYKKSRVILSGVDDTIEDIARKRSRKLLFKNDVVQGIFKIYYPLYQIFFDYYPPRGNYQSLTCFVDGITGEILLGKGERTRGVRDLMKLSPDQRSVMLFIMRKGQVTQSSIARATRYDKGKVKRIISSLIQKGLLQIKKHKKFEAKQFEEIKPQIQYKIIDDPRKKIVKSFEIDEDYLDDESVINPLLKKQEARKAAEIWERSVVWDTKLVYYPCFLVSYDAKYEIIDGVTGKKDDYVKSMLQFRL
jgi:predicted transcriptional regulator